MKQIQDLINMLINVQLTNYIISSAVLVVFVVCSSLIAKIVMKIFKIQPKTLERNSKIYSSIKFIWIVSGIYVSILLINMPNGPQRVVNKLYKLSMIFGVTRFIAHFIRPNLKIFNKVRADKNSRNESTINFGIKVLRAIIYMIGAFVFIAELGYDLSGIVTGLGIGSVVVALAAQDLAKNMFAGVAILTDKTFVIGDTIETKGIYGIVEDITFRTTRVRKLDNTIVTIPNSSLVDSEIVNWSKIQKRRYDCTLKLAFGTSQEKINDVIKKLGFEFQKNKDIIKGSAKIYFSGIEQDGYKISLYMYTSITDYDCYLEFINSINSVIIELLDKENVKLIYPTYDVCYLQKQ